MAAGDEGSGPPIEGGADERSTERRIAAAFAASEESTLEGGAGEVLGALTRASVCIREGLLEEARVHIDRALELDAQNPKAQDLLAMVHFRSGQYQAAIRVYEQLRNAYPRDAAVKVNLALSYMQMNHVEAARGELEEVVRANPHHRRAWGYLGLAYERLGTDELALRAFERGKLPEMAARIAKRRDRLTVPVPASVVDEATSDVPPSPASGVGFEELDAGELAPDLAEPVRSKNPLSAPAAPRLAGVPGVEEILDESERSATVAPAEAHVPSSVIPPGLAVLNSATAMPGPRLSIFAAPATPESRALIFPEEPGVLRDASTGLVLVTVGGGFTARLESVRTYASGLRTGVLERQVRGRSTSEPFGGFAAPLVRFEGTGGLALGPRAGHTLLALALGEAITVVREDLVAGFELRIEYENVRQPLEDGDGASMVELHGPGAVVLESPHEIRAIAIAPDARVNARREVVAGWSGSVTCRSIPTREAPAAQSGLVTFEGHGVLLVRAR